MTPSMENENLALKSMRKTSPTRASGRVGARITSEKKISKKEGSPISVDFLNIYRKLWDLAEERDSELTRAITYGLKLLARPSKSFKSKIFKI